MKNKFLLLAAEALAVNLIAVFFVWRLYLLPGLSSLAEENAASIAGRGLAIIAVVYIVTMALIVVQSYFAVIKPYNDHIKEMEKAVEENKKSEQIRREFVANVSHELKTPLTSISGFIETLQEGAAEDPEIRTKFIDIIAIETSRLKRLIEDLLVLSDIENKRDSEMKEFEIRSAVESTAEALQPIADGKNIRIILELERGLYIKGSADRFRQMMVNLIENAIKYSDEGSRIWVKAVSLDNRIEVSVKDEGIGIAEEHHDRLFERFYRVDKSRSKKAGGTGLGLSIVKHIAVLFGASLKVESQVGKGTTFFVIFEKEKGDLY